MTEGLIPPGKYFMQGNVACVEAALIAGCRFFAGYPITPSSEILQWMSYRLPQVGGHFIQMEDEIASIMAVLGASNAGVKSMTATSGPGFSLMQEGIGFGMMTETPCVIVNVQRGGPSTGIPTLVGQGDVMQARWGSHGDYEAIVYAPNNVQEMFDLTIKAFNASEEYRQPVVLLADQVISHMYGSLTVPPHDEIKIVNRKLPCVPPNIPDFKPFDAKYEVPPMALAGMGYRVHVTGLTHDERGYPYYTHEVSTWCVKHLVSKVRNNAKKIWEVEHFMLEDADIVLISYGITSRSSYQAVKIARSEGIKAGMLRLITLWPFPDEIVKKVSEQAKVIVVPEINMGQIIHPVREVAECLVVGLSWAPGAVPTPDVILDTIRYVSR
ncbi:MAG: 2-oxoacid:acceptor oxidoreductase subunit alpha [Nitrososphaerota archaeon]